MRVRPQSLWRRIAKILSYGRLLHNDGEEARLQRCQNDVETNAYSQAYRISHEHGVCTASGSRENEFRVKVHADWTPVMCVALGILACLVLVAYHDGRRYTVKNHEVEVKIPKETLDTALRQKISRNKDEMVRKRKVWNCGGSPDQVENLMVPIDEIIISRNGECFHVLRDCKDVVDTIANSRRKCNWCCGI